MVQSTGGAVARDNMVHVRPWHGKCTVKMYGTPMCTQRNASFSRSPAPQRHAVLTRTTQLSLPITLFRKPSGRGASFLSSREPGPADRKRARPATESKAHLDRAGGRLTKPSRVAAGKALHEHRPREPTAAALRSKADAGWRKRNIPLRPLLYSFLQAVQISATSGKHTTSTG